MIDTLAFLMFFALFVFFYLLLEPGDEK